MNELLAKLSSYNLFNYLLPGTIFVILSHEFTAYSFIQSNIVLAAFLYYFIGMIVSRVGSIILEPLLIWTGFLKFAEYSDFIAASKEDDKIELLSEANNTYRTFCSMFILLILLMLYKRIEQQLSFLGAWSPSIIVIGLLALFLFSYRKQTGYIKTRIEANK